MPKKPAPALKSVKTETKEEKIEKVSEVEEVEETDADEETEETEEAEDEDEDEEELPPCELYVFEELDVDEDGEPILDEAGSEVWVIARDEDGIPEGVFQYEDEAKDTLDELIDSGEDPATIRFRKYMPGFILKA